MKQLGEQLIELIDKRERYESYARNSEDGSETEWMNKVMIQKLSIQIKDKVGEILIKNKAGSHTNI